MQPPIQPASSGRVTADRRLLRSATRDGRCVYITPPLPSLLFPSPSLPLTFSSPHLPSPHFPFLLFPSPSLPLTFSSPHLPSPHFPFLLFPSPSLPLTSPPLTFPPLSSPHLLPILLSPLPILSPHFLSHLLSPLAPPSHPFTAYSTSFLPTCHQPATTHHIHHVASTPPTSLYNFPLLPSPLPLLSPSPSHLYRSDSGRGILEALGAAVLDPSTERISATSAAEGKKVFRTGTEVTLRGREYIGWETEAGRAELLAAHADKLILSFKTRFPAGLLFFTGDGKDYVNVALREGAVHVTLDMGGDPIEVIIGPDKTRFDDNRWHVLRLERRVKEINSHTSFCSLSVSVDGMYDQRRTTAGPFNQLASSRLYVGGSNHPALLPGAKTKANFIGCLKNVVYQCDGVVLRLLQMARQQHQLLRVSGHVKYQCQEVAAAEALSFTSSESLLDGPGDGVVNFLQPSATLILPPWTALNQGTLAFKFRTSEPDGLLMYNPGTVTAKGDFFALEMMDGQVYFHLNLGSGAHKVKVTIRRVDDARWHEISYSRDGREGVVAVDEIVQDFTMPGDSNQLDLGGNLYVGGIGSAETMDGVRVPPELWMGRLKKGYVGCMRDLVLNGHAIDLASYAKKQDSGSILQMCHNDGGSCESDPCLHGGSCTQGWGRFVCDCTNTAFVGPTCGRNAATLNFNGSQGLYITKPREDASQAEQITLRFSTTHASGLLLRTWSPASSASPASPTSSLMDDTIEMALIGGQIRTTLKIGGRVKEVHVGHNLNDGRWHRLRYFRRASALTVQLDTEHPVTRHIISNRDVIRYQNIYVGHVPNSTMDWLMSSMTSSNVVSLEDTRPGGPLHSSVAPFVGDMQSLMINGLEVFEQARSGHMPDIQVTAKFGTVRPTVHHPVSFKTTTAFVALPQLRSYAFMDIYFQFKTIQASGIIMYNAGKGHDFLAIELVNGHIHLVFNLGSGPIQLRDSSKTALNDNQWHSVTVGRPSAHRHTLMVDDDTAIVTSTGSNRYIDLQGYLYLGGVPPEMYPSLPRHVVSGRGYQGCLASMELQGDAPDPAGRDVPVRSSNVRTGCDGPSSQCRADACSNGGVCVQQWNSYSCNCDMTSYTGPTCSDESTAYEFGQGTGVVTFEYPEGQYQDKHKDLLALGFMTKQTDDATLLRLDSANSNDYVELEVVDGKVVMVYNMGTEDHPIAEPVAQVNDGLYHVVKFVRTGANATLQVDDYDVLSKNPKDELTPLDLRLLTKLRTRYFYGHQLSVFNGQSSLMLGGHRSKREAVIKKPFQGILAGVVANGERPLDLAAERDPRVKVEGDVHLLLSLPQRIERAPASRAGAGHMQQMPAGGAQQGDNDDLVYSGAGSDCDIDDEDQCVPVFETGSGDDLITPVYIPPTRPTTPKPPPAIHTSGGRIVQGRTGADGRMCDDEEDCYIGSGSGEFNTDEGNLIEGERVGFQPSATSPPMLIPDVIHSEEHESSSATDTTSNNREGDTDHTDVSGTGGSDGIDSSRIVDGTGSVDTSDQRSNIRTGVRGGSGAQTYNRSPASTEHPFDGSGNESNENSHPEWSNPPSTDFHEHYPDYGFPDVDLNLNEYEAVGVDEPKIEVPDNIQGVPNETTKQVPLIISIVAGILIVIIIVILIILKCNSKSREISKIEEAKTYSSLTQGPTMIVNGQNNGTTKAGDRRPVKKERKDVKEWYV
ncbi:neurexin-1 [Hyalella azteca]|uniref:Neurexin-1 n=1 Tax=Hyalella azteca TaxID=294128 RepID=A0A979FPI3_HYAAZ|nr:neurexin-1 [Hyalella azteca]